jgi:hypothetical protein
MHLHALVVAVGGAARIRDLRDASARRLHQHRGGIDVAGFTDRLVHQCRAERKDFDRLLRQQEARHVEIMDHHVAEESARAFHIVERRRPGIA